MNRRDFLQTAAVLAAPPLDERMQAARQSALALLQPTQKQLEHGLELHAHSLVFDCYGFSPTSAPDLAVLTDAAKAGASSLEMQDLLEEGQMTRHVSDPGERADYLAAWEASGVRCVFQNAGEEGSDALRLLKRLARFTFVTDMLGDRVARAAYPAQIEDAWKSGKRCLYFTGNGVPLAEQWNSVEDELRYVRIFFQLGVRMMHLTYNRRNVIGDGCAEPGNAGLSDFGRAVIREMNRVGVLVDCAHSGWRTSLEAARASAKPMVASHSGALALNQHIRFKPDEVIRAIADTGGYMGICCISGFLGHGTGDIRHFLAHIDYVAKKFGPEHVAIGTDSGHVSRRTLAERSRLPRVPSRTRYEAFWPAGASGLLPQHPSLAWTNWPLFTVGLVQKGYSDTDIQKILGGNVMRVARAVLPEALPPA